MFTKYSDKLFCFSPPVMLATFVIESVLASYTLLRYKLTTITRLVATMLTLLAIFQLSEFNVCGRVGVSASVWSRIGYVAITLLPALGIHLIQAVAKRGWFWLKWLAYASSLFFVAIFGFAPSAFVGHVCAGNYAIFQLTNHTGELYFIYYYFWLFAGIVMSLYFAINAKLHIRKALILQIVGYLSFLLPTGIVNDVNPKTIAGIPSVMCGFAVIYALALVLGIVPLALGKFQKPKPL